MQLPSEHTPGAALAAHHAPASASTWRHATALPPLHADIALTSRFLTTWAGRCMCSIIVNLALCSSTSSPAEPCCIESLEFDHRSCPAPGQCSEILRPTANQLRRSSSGPRFQAELVTSQPEQANHIENRQQRMELARWNSYDWLLTSMQVIIMRKPPCSNKCLSLAPRSRTSSPTYWYCIDKLTCDGMEPDALVPNYDL